MGNTLMVNLACESCGKTYKTDMEGYNLKECAECSEDKLFHWGLDELYWNI